MATNTTTTEHTTTQHTTAEHNTATPPQEMGGDIPSPPSYYPQPAPPVQPPIPAAYPTHRSTEQHQEITTAPTTAPTDAPAAATTTTTTTHITETFAPVDEKSALQHPQPALVQPMNASGQLGQNPVPPGANPLDYPVPIETLRDTPRAIDCPFCNRRSMTALNLESGNTVVGWAIALCCLTGICCAWIPCVMDSCKDTIHYCSQCRNRVITITNSGRVNVHPKAVTATTAKERAG
ncbi:hypothetical protein FQN54_005219 [Arachnomyces sp. PD_36]|nr:hypothetical protein FQN54_005219 [Arachnomyces sp. PD_36]